MTREEAIYRLKNMAWLYGSAEREQNIEAIDMAISALSAEPIERIGDSTIKVEYKGYEDIGRIILTGEDIFCKIFYEDAKQKYEDDDNYDALIPDEYMTEPSDLISREEAMNTVWNEAKEYEKEFMVSEDSEDYSHDVGYLSGMHRAKLILKLMPSVSAERVGVWIWRGFNIECSECGDMPTFDSTESLPNYCPNCGARMENTK